MVGGKSDIKITKLVVRFATSVPIKNNRSIAPYAPNRTAQPADITEKRICPKRIARLTKIKPHLTSKAALTRKLLIFAEPLLESLVYSNANQRALFVRIFGVWSQTACLVNPLESFPELETFLSPKTLSAQDGPFGTFF